MVFLCYFIFAEIIALYAYALLRYHTATSSNSKSYSHKANEYVLICEYRRAQKIVIFLALRFSFTHLTIVKVHARASHRYEINSLAHTKFI
jgi:hypothetical protein